MWDFSERENKSLHYGTWYFVIRRKLCIKKPFLTSKYYHNNRIRAVDIHLWWREKQNLQVVEFCPLAVQPQLSNPEKNKKKFNNLNHANTLDWHFTLHTQKCLKNVLINSILKVVKKIIDLIHTLIFWFWVAISWSFWSISWFFVWK